MVRYKSPLLDEELELSRGDIVTVIIFDKSNAEHYINVELLSNCKNNAYIKSIVRETNFSTLFKIGHCIDIKKEDIETN